MCFRNFFLGAMFDGPAINSVISRRAFAMFRKQEADGL